MGGVGADVLQQFESVRGVRRVRVKGSVPGFEGYVAWLVRRMMMRAAAAAATAPAPAAVAVAGGVGDGCVGDGDGEEVEEYVPVDETERRRLSGWV